MVSLEQLAGVAAFVSAAETGSFSSAAQRMHLSRSAIAKSVARLEERLGVRLIHRTTRSQSLTEEGHAFYARCARVLEELEHAQEELEQGRNAVVGRLRLTMPVHLGRSGLMPALLKLAAQHPGLMLEISFTDRRVDLFEEGYDIAVRSGPLPDTANLRQRPLGTESLLLAASPAYLRRYGVPSHPEELRTHSAIAYGRADKNVGWRFHAGDAFDATVHVPVRFGFDDFGVMLQAAVDGLGVARLPAWLAAPHIERGELVELLPGFSSPRIPLNVIWPAHRTVPRRLRAVIEILCTTGIAMDRAPALRETGE